MSAGMSASSGSETIASRRMRGNMQDIIWSIQGNTHTYTHTHTHMHTGLGFFFLFLGGHYQEFLWFARVLWAAFIT
jgi:outer membrane protease